jgi:glyoxylate reductase
MTQEQEAPPKPRVLLMHSILDPGPALLEDACEVVPYRSSQPLDEDHVRSAAEGCAGIVSQLMDPITDKVLSTPGLKIVSNVAVGFDNIDVPAATKRGVMVTNTPGVLDETTADFAFALLMAAARRVVQGDNFVRAGNFKGWALDMMLGQDVHDSTLGIIGIGRIGRAVARRARSFNMRVIYHDPNPLRPEAERELGVRRVDLDHLLHMADFISVHVPLTEETRHLLGRDQFAKMKPSCVLVNTSRGPVIDEAALADALKNHQIFAAGLDVYENEPEVHPALLALRNVVLAPHIASASVRTRSEMSAVAARNMVAGVRGGRPANLLNPEVMR